MLAGGVRKGYSLQVLADGFEARAFWETTCFVCEPFPSEVPSTPSAAADPGSTASTRSAPAVVSL